MLSAWKRTSPKRWPRGQRFSLTPSGARAEEAYRTAVAESRGSGRAALDGALASWAESLSLAAKDGIVLAEVRAGRTGVPQLVKELEPAGFAADEVRAAIERLVGAAMVEPLPLPSETARQPGC